MSKSKFFKNWLSKNFFYRTLFYGFLLGLNNNLTNDHLLLCKNRIVSDKPLLICKENLVMAYDINIIYTKQSRIRSSFHFV